MRTLFIFILLFTIGALNAQSKVTIKQDSFKSIALNLKKSGDMMMKYHQQQTMGRVMIFTGAGLYTAIIGTNYLFSSVAPVPKGVVLLCSAITLSGVIIQIDSYKYLKKSAIYLQQAGSTVTLSYVF